jgi:protein-tyrosine phosphatase
VFCAISVDIFWQNLSVQSTLLLRSIRLLSDQLKVNWIERVEMTSSYKPERLRFVDQQGNNLLFRSSVPVAGDEGCERYFAQDQLLLDMANQARNANVTLVEKALMSRFSLLSRFWSHDNIKVEKVFYRQNPDVGTYTLRDFDFIASASVFVNALGQNVDKLVLQVRQLLQETVEPTNLFIHCQAGLDRTGVISAGYAIRFQGFDLQAALQQNVALGLDRPPDYSSNLCIVAYAYYLSTLAVLEPEDPNS